MLTRQYGRLDVPDDSNDPDAHNALGRGKEQGETPKIDTANARRVSATLDNLRPLDEAQIGRMVDAWRKTGFLRA